MLIYFFFLSYLNNQTREIKKKKRGKKNPLVHQQSSQQNFTSHSLTLSLYPCISSSGSLYYKKIIIKSTKLHTKNTKKEKKRESWTWIEGSEEKTWALTNFKRKENKKRVFLLQGLCVFFVVCVWQCKKIDGTWLFVKLGFNVFLSFWIRERSFSSFLSFYARE